MIFSIIFLVSIVTIFRTGSAAYSPDLVKALPGYSDPIPYQQYSGYLNGSSDGNIQMHYWFVESQRDPSSDPLVLWLNGGPGCSSMDGMLYEHGPLLVAESGETLQMNPYSWNKIANIIYLESPAGVGYSYARDGNNSVDDDLAAEENFNALLNFLDKFPEYKGHDLYITGESYGGIYVPTLTYKIFTTDSVLQSMLKGFAVGNGLLSSDNNTNSLITFAYTHGIVGNEEYTQLLDVCGCGSEVQCNFVESSNLNCKTMVLWTLNHVYNPNLNMYDVADVCYHAPNSNPAKGDIIKAARAKESVFEPFKERGWGVLVDSICGSGVTVPCIDSVDATIYLNNKNVRSVLHIEPSLPPWSICSNIPYARTYNDMTHQFKTLIDGGIQALVYNGDVDAACNFIGDELFVKNLGYSATSKFNPWLTDDQQIGGWWRSYGDRLQFTTVRGAGHTVPQYKPKESFQMWQAFLANNYN